MEQAMAACRGSVARASIENPGWLKRRLIAGTVTPWRAIHQMIPAGNGFRLVNFDNRVVTKLR